MAVTGNINVRKSSVRGGVSIADAELSGNMSASGIDLNGDMESLKVELKAAIQQKNGSMTAILRSKTQSIYEEAVRFGYAGTLEQFWNQLINSLDVVDNLTTDDGSKPLSARQGKVLNEKIDRRTQWYDL